MPHYKIRVVHSCATYCWTTHVLPTVHDGEIIDGLAASLWESKIKDSPLPQNSEFGLTITHRATLNVEIGLWICIFLMCTFVLNYMLPFCIYTTWHTLMRNVRSDQFSSKYISSNWSSLVSTSRVFCISRSRCLQGKLMFFFA